LRMKDKIKKNIKSLNISGHRILSAVLLAGMFCMLLFIGYHMFRSTLTEQKNSMKENAIAYTSVMDERISSDLHGFMELNLSRENESALFTEFFYTNTHNRSTEFLGNLHLEAIDVVDKTGKLDGLIMYRPTDSTLVSTMSEFSLLAKINPAYNYLMNTVAQVDIDEPTFVCTSDGSVLYYYPVLDTESPKGQILDCVIAILHKSDGFLNAQLPLASSLATFAVLKDGQVLSTEGHNALSQKLVATIAEIAKGHPDVYEYTDVNLPTYYFYITPSKVSELSYCYYEPALSGDVLIKEAITAHPFLFLIMLLIAIFSFSLIITTLSIHKSENRVVNIATGDTMEEITFGSLPYFSGIIIDYHHRGGETVNPETLKLFDQIIRENLTVNKILYQLSPQRNSDCLQYYINYANYNMRVLSDSLKMNLFNAEPDYAINIFYSAPVSTYSEMEAELLYLHQNLRYSLILGYGVRLSIEQIQLMESSTQPLDLNVASTIQNHLRTRAYDDLYSYLENCKNYLQIIHPHEQHYSFKETYRFMEEAFSAVKLFFQENNFTHPLVQCSCSCVLRSNPGYRQFCDYLISSIKDYQHENQHVLSSRNEQIMNSIYMYIEQDLAGANLNAIARKMQMTDSHLSRIFKKNTGSNFSEYLSDRKLEEAAKLLLQDNKLKVAEIADTLGYGNPTYFLSRFKAKYGVSPSAYRKAHIMEKDSQ